MYCPSNAFWLYRVSRENDYNCCTIFITVVVIIFTAHLVHTLQSKMTGSSSRLTIQDLELTANKLQMFALEVFAGNDERKKVQLLEGMENLMNPIATFPIKRPIEVADIVSEAKRIKLTASKLPNEIWMKIMSYLKNEDIFGNFALVNKHFHGLTTDPSALKYLQLKDFHFRIISCQGALALSK